MPVYNFKRETKIYVVQNGKIYTLDVYPDLNFSQTYNETSVPVKTLHSQYNMFDNAVISKANPANFSFTIPILYEADLNVVFNLLLNYASVQNEVALETADLYFESNSEIYKIEKCVIESGTFQLVNNAIITLNISGTGRRLSKFADTIPGTKIARSSTRNFGRITRLGITLDSVVQTAITSVSIEVKNNVSWIDYTTIQNGLLVDNGASEAVMLPEAFVVSGRTISGTVQQHITSDTNNNVQRHSTNSSLLIDIGELNKPSILQINIPTVVYTNRLEIQEIFIQSYDFRMTSNPMDLKTVIIK